MNQSLFMRWRTMIADDIGFADVAWHIGIALMVNILALSVPLMMIQVYDRIIPYRAYDTLFALTLGVGFALIMDMVLRMARSYLINWSSSAHEHAGGARVMDHIMRVDQRVFDTVDSGTHVQHIAALSRLREFYSGQSLVALVDMPFIVIFLGLIAYLGGWLVLVPLALLLLFLFSAIMTGRQLRTALEQRAHDDAVKAGFIMSVLQGIHTVKSMTLEMPLLRRFERHQKAATNHSYRVASINGVAGLLGNGFAQASLVLTATIGAYLVLNNTLSVGAMSACVLLAGRAIQPVQRMMGTWLRTQDLAVAHEQVDRFFGMDAATPYAGAVRTRPHGRLSLDKVSFMAEGSVILRDVTLDLEPGEVVFIGGKKGSGKSTLLQVIAGLHAPTSGRIQIDGINPARHTRQDLLRHVGYLPPEATIFKGTIMDNITGFRDDRASIDAARTAAHDLGLDDTVNPLPRGYATMLYDSMSDPIPPGVKQRIALARVLMHRPALLLFDDADRTLDKEGYNRLFSMLGRDKRSMVIVSNDRNLASLATRAFYLDDGVLRMAGPNTINATSFFQRNRTDDT